MIADENTPGPWRVGAVGEHVFAGAQVVAAMKADGVYERMADARLIAAAPDLLTALQAIVAVEASSDGDVKFREALYITLREARAAIARATGEPT